MDNPTVAWYDFSENVNNSTDSVYTVPSGYVLEIYQFWFNSYCVANGAGYSKCYLDDGGAVYIFGRCTHNLPVGVTGDNKGFGVAFPEPFVVTEGQIIKVQSSSADVFTAAGFSGLLVKI